MCIFAGEFSFFSHVASLQLVVVSIIRRRLTTNFKRFEPKIDKYQGLKVHRRCYMEFPGARLNCPSCQPRLPRSKLRNGSRPSQSNIAQSINITINRATDVFDCVYFKTKHLMIFTLLSICHTAPSNLPTCHSFTTASIRAQWGFHTSGCPGSSPQA